ncbi:MAG TPA: hypothetical protein VEV44_09710 [Pseudoneobacillus sp.]|nr:hypothetical protein [Pseudoneobacillus sp.]
MDTKQIASFIVRFQLTDRIEETKEKQWRIKVTHVQDEHENLFESIDDAMIFMKKMVEDS